MNPSSLRFLPLVSASLLGLCISSAHAATFTVSNLNDSGEGSLRQAIASANAEPDADIITFSSGATGTLLLSSGELVVGDNVAIEGPGADVLTVSGNNLSRIFNVTGKGVAISGLTLANGRVVGTAGGSPGGPAYGGALYNAGVLTLREVAFVGNSAIGGVGDSGGRGASKGKRGGEARGGAVFNLGTLRLADVSFRNNNATGGKGGAGGYYPGPPSSSGDGGDGGPAVGGALFNGGTFEQSGVTLADNTVVGGAGGERTGRGGGGSKGAPGPAIEPGIHDVLPTATGATFSLSQYLAFSAQLQATGDLLTYSATNLPAGVTLNPGTGVLSGAPTVARSGLQASFRVSDGFRTSTVAPLTFNIAPVNSKFLVVTTLSDDGNTNDGLVSLREAVGYANAKPGADTITFDLPQGTSATPVILLTQGKLVVTADSLNIAWPGAQPLTLSGPNGIWSVKSGTSLSLRRFKMSDGYLYLSNGMEQGIIDNNGNLSLTECVVSDNKSIAILNGRTLTIDRSTLSNNRGTSAGVIQSQGNVTLTNSTLYGNTAQARAGVIYTGYDTTLVMDSCTVTANAVDNTPASPSISSNSNLVAITNSIFAGNDPYLGRNSDNNLIVDTARQAGLETNAAGVAVLKDNGGPTPTVALLPNSPAINGSGTTVGSDQRGVARSGRPDLGAFELATPTPKVESLSPLNTSDKVGNKRTFSVTVSHPSGAGAIKEVWLLVNKQLSWNAGATLIYVPSVATPTKGQLFLRSGDAFLPAAQIGANSGAVLDNGAVRVVARDVTVTTSGNSLTLNLPLTIGNGLVGTNRAFARVVDKAGALDPTAAPSDSGYRRFGNYTITPQFSGATNNAPTLSGLTPTVTNTALDAAGVGAVQNFTFSARDADGSGDIESVWFSAGKSSNWTKSATFIYTPQTRRLVLRSDDGQSFLGGGVVGTAGIIENSQVRVDLSQVQVVAGNDGRTLIVTLPLQAKGGLLGLNKVYLRVQDLARATATNGDAQGYVQSGTWNVVQRASGTSKTASSGGGA